MLGGSRPMHDFHPIITAEDLHLFNEGTHRQLWRKLGAHVIDVHGVRGTQFSVWAPNARRVELVGDFNGWTGTDMAPVQSSGIWTSFMPGVAEGALYKYRIHGPHDGYRVE